MAAANEVKQYLAARGDETIPSSQLYNAIITKRNMDLLLVYLKLLKTLYHDGVIESDIYVELLIPTMYITPRAFEIESDMFSPLIYEQHLNEVSRDQITPDRANVLFEFSIKIFKGVEQNVIVMWLLDQLEPHYLFQMLPKLPLQYVTVMLEKYNCPESPQVNINLLSEAIRFNFTSRFDSTLPSITISILTHLQHANLSAKKMNALLCSIPNSLHPWYAWKSVYDYLINAKAKPEYLQWLRGYVESRKNDRDISSLPGFYELETSSLFSCVGNNNVAYEDFPKLAKRRGEFAKCMLSMDIDDCKSSCELALTPETSLHKLFWTKPDAIFASQINPNDKIIKAIRDRLMKLAQTTDSEEVHQLARPAMGYDGHNL